MLQAMCPEENTTIVGRLAFVMGLLMPAVAIMQTADAGPAPSSSAGASKSISRAAPSVRFRGVKPGAPLSADEMGGLPKPTAMEQAEKRQLDRDMDICVGC